MKNNIHSTNDYKKYIDAHKVKPLINIENELFKLSDDIEKIKNISDLLEKYDITFKNTCEEWKNIDEDIHHLTDSDKLDFVSKNKGELEEIIIEIDMICNNYEKNLSSLPKLSHLTDELEKSSNVLKEMLKQITKNKNRGLSPVTYENKKINIKIDNIDMNVGYEIKDKKRTMIVHMPDKKTIRIFEVI